MLSRRLHHALSKAAGTAAARPVCARASSSTHAAFRASATAAPRVGACAFSCDVSAGAGGGARHVHAPPPPSVAALRLAGAMRGGGGAARAGASSRSSSASRSSAWSSAALAAVAAAATGTASLVLCGEDAAEATASSPPAAAANRDAKAEVSMHNRITGNYENRIRFHSAPEKVFEYFASVVDDSGEVYMTSDDFMRAITPYNPYLGGEVGTKNSKYDNKARLNEATPETRAKYKALLADVLLDSKITPDEATRLHKLRQELSIDNNTHVSVLKELGMTMHSFEKLLEKAGGPPADPFYELIDSDGDGLLSYAEYVFFVTLLSTPDSHFDVAFRMFDIDGDGGVDHREFAKLMALIRQKSTTGAAVRDSTLAGAKGRVDQGGQLDRFFGPARDRKLSINEFRSYVVQLQGAIRAREFRAWDKSNTGYLSPFEFAMFLVSYAPAHMMEALLDRAEKRVKQMDGCVSLAEYVAFHDTLQHLDEMEVALDMVASAGSDHTCGAEEFSRATFAAANAAVLERLPNARAKLVPKRGLSDLQVKIVYTMFDANDDGSLDDKEFMDHMRERASRGLTKRRDLGVVDYLANVISCAQHALTH